MKYEVTVNNYQFGKLNYQMPIMKDIITIDRYHKKVIYEDIDSMQKRYIETIVSKKLTEIK